MANTPPRKDMQHCDQPPFQPSSSVLRWGVVTTTRLVTGIAALTLGHALANERMGSEPWQAWECRILSNPALEIASTVAAALNFTLALNGAPPDAAVGMAQVLLGVLLNIAAKPHAWLFSLKWQDCSRHFESSTLMYRMLSLSYPLIAFGAMEAQLARFQGGSGGLVPVLRNPRQFLSWQPWLRSLLGASLLWSVVLPVVYVVALVTFFGGA